MGEQPKKIKPSIPADEVTVETIMGGVIVTLGPKEVFWQLDSGKVELNAFTGEISSKVDGKKLSETEVAFLLNGIRTGRIMVVDKAIVGKPVETKWLLSEYAPGARKLLDYTDDEFERAVNGNFSLKLLNTALEIEKDGKNRKKRVETLTEKISEIIRSE